MILNAVALNTIPLDARVTSDPGAIYGGGPFVFLASAALSTGINLGASAAFRWASQASLSTGISLASSAAWRVHGSASFTVRTQYPVRGKLAADVQKPYLGDKVS